MSGIALMTNSLWFNCSNQMQPSIHNQFMSKKSMDSDILEPKELTEKEHSWKDQELYSEPNQQLTCWDRTKKGCSNFINRTIDYFQFDRMFQLEGEKRIDLRRCQKRFLQNFDQTYSEREIKFGYSFQEMRLQKEREQERKQKTFCIEFYRFICCEGGNEMIEPDEVYKSQREYEVLMRKRVMRRKEEYEEYKKSQIKDDAVEQNKKELVRQIIQVDENVLYYQDYEDMEERDQNKPSHLINHNTIVSQELKVNPNTHHIPESHKQPIGGIQHYSTNHHYNTQIRQTTQLVNQQQEGKQKKNKKKKNRIEKPEGHASENAFKISKVQHSNQHDTMAARTSSNQNHEVSVIHHHHHTTHHEIVSPKENIERTEGDIGEESQIPASHELLFEMSGRERSPHSSPNNNQNKVRSSELTFEADKPEYDANPQEAPSHLKKRKVKQAMNLQPGNQHSMTLDAYSASFASKPDYSTIQTSQHRHTQHFNKGHSPISEQRNDFNYTQDFTTILDPRLGTIQPQKEIHNGEEANVEGTKKKRKRKEKREQESFNDEIFNSSNFKGELQTSQKKGDWDFRPEHVQAKKMRKNKRKRLEDEKDENIESSIAINESEMRESEFVLGGSTVQAEKKRRKIKIKKQEMEQELDEVIDIDL